MDKQIDLSIAITITTVITIAIILTIIFNTIQNLTSESDDVVKVEHQLMRRLAHTAQVLTLLI